MKKQPILFVFIAPVGSGKTHIARILAKKLDAVHVRTDDIRVDLRKQEKRYSRAPRMAREMIHSALEKGESVISDFDAVLPQRRKELCNLAKKYGARCFFIRVKTPEKIIFRRLRKHHYTKDDLFQSAKEATRVYFIRRKLHKNLKVKPDFVIDNGKLLAPQIKKVAAKIRAVSSVAER